MKLGSLAWWLKILRRNPAPKLDRILVDREGVAYPPTRPVKLQGKR